MLVSKVRIAGEEIAPRTFAGVSVYPQIERSGPQKGRFVVRTSLESVAEAMEADGWTWHDKPSVSPVEPEEVPAAPEAIPEAGAPEEAVSGDEEAAPDAGFDLSVLMGSTSEVSAFVAGVTDPDYLDALIEAEAAGENKLGRERSGVMSALVKAREALS